MQNIPTTIPVVRLPSGTIMTAELVSTLLTDWITNAARYKRLQDYYIGRHEIINRSFTDNTKPNNKVINNFPRYITDVKAGYFTGKPISYKCDDASHMGALQEVFDINDEQDVNSELDKISNIKGHAFELLFIDEDGNIRFKEVEPDEIIMIYSADITEKPIAAIRHYKNVEPVTKVETEVVDVYTDTQIFHYNIIQGKTKKPSTILTGTEEHFFGEVPVIEYVNNKERLGSFEDVIALVDAYNLAQSDSINEIQYFNDAYLKLKNMSGTDSEDVAKMKEDRVLLLDGDGDAEWLVKNINDTYLENIKDRVSKDIHKFSKTPNLVSEEFVSNLSGVAIRYKVWGLEQDISVKERKWKQSIQRRIKLITNILNTKGNNFDSLKVEITFTRNLPQNITELGQLVSQLKGTVSDETLISQLPFVDNVAKEIERLKEQQKNNPFLDTVNNAFSNTNPNNESMSSMMDNASSPQG